MTDEEEFKEGYESFMKARKHKSELALNPDYVYFSFDGIHFDQPSLPDTEDEYEIENAKIEYQKYRNERRRYAFINKFEYCTSDNLGGFLDEQLKFFLRKYPDQMNHWLDTVEDIVREYTHQPKFNFRREWVDEWTGPLRIRVYNLLGMTRLEPRKLEKQKFRFTTTKRRSVLVPELISGPSLERKYDKFEEWLAEKREEVRIQEHKLSHPQIALLYYYEGWKITSNNADEEAKKYGQTSGQKLSATYEDKQEQLNRINGRYAVKDIETILPILSENAKQLAKSELILARSRKK